MSSVGLWGRVRNKNKSQGHDAFEVVHWGKVPALQLNYGIICIHIFFVFPLDCIFWLQLSQLWLLLSQQCSRMLKDGSIQPTQAYPFVHFHSSTNTLFVTGQALCKHLLLSYAKASQTLCVVLWVRVHDHIGQHQAQLSAIISFSTCMSVILTRQHFIISTHHLNYINSKDYSSYFTGWTAVQIVRCVFYESKASWCSTERQSFQSRH